MQQKEVLPLLISKNHFETAPFSCFYDLQSAIFFGFLKKQMLKCALAPFFCGYGMGRGDGQYNWNFWLGVNPPAVCLSKNQHTKVNRGRVQAIC